MDHGPLTDQRRRRSVLTGQSTCRGGGLKIRTGGVKKPARHQAAGSREALAESGQADLVAAQFVCPRSSHWP